MVLSLVCSDNFGPAVVDFWPAVFRLRAGERQSLFSLDLKSWAGPSLSHLRMTVRKRKRCGVAFPKILIIL